MSDINLILTAIPFVVNGAWTVEQFHQALIASITAGTTSSNVLLGQDGGSAPVTDVGPWLNGTTWYAWNGSAYIPATIKVGNATYQITLAGTPTANRVLTLPDKSGTLATTDDVYTGRGTTSLSGATPTIDWSLTWSFALSMTASATISMSNSLPGQVVQIAIYNPAVWTVTWNSVNWVGGVAPTQTTGGKTDIYELKNINGNIYGRVIPNY